MGRVIDGERRFGQQPPDRPHEHARVRHGARHRRRELPDGGWPGAAPHRGDTHLVDVPMRADVQLPGRPCIPRPRRCSRVRDPLHQHDRTRRVDLGEVRRRPLAHVNRRRRQPRGRPREGVRDGPHRRAVDRHLRRSGQADVDGMAEQHGPVSGPVQLRPDIFRAGKLLRGARQLHVPDECPAMGHQPRPFHLVDRRLAYAGPPCAGPILRPGAGAVNAARPAGPGPDGPAASCPDTRGGTARAAAAPARPGRRSRRTRPGTRAAAR